MKKVFLIFLFVLALNFYISQECSPGYEFKPSSGVGCVQIDCNNIADAHYGYVGDCICGSSGSMYENPEDPNKECYRDFDYESCPGCLYACVHFDENCPEDLEPDISLPEKFDNENEGNEDYIPPEDIAPLGSEGDGSNRPIEELSQLYIVGANKKDNSSKEYLYSTDELDEYACSPAEYPVFYKNRKTGEIYTSCSCRPGFKRGETGCVFDKPKIKLNDYDMEKLEKSLLNLQPNEREIIEVEFEKKLLKIGIIRRPDYSLSFTVDGKKWDENLKDLIDPSTWKKTKDRWDKTWSYLNPINWFDWHTKYKDKDKELKWQVADSTLQRYDKDIKKPKHYMYAVEYWYKYAEDKRQAAIVLRDSGFLPGSFDLSKKYLWEDLKGHLYAVPAESIKKFASELRTDDFAQAFSIYANLRENQEPKEIINNPPEELELAISIGTSSTLGHALLYQKYEETYQRYLLSKDFQKDKK